MFDVFKQTRVYTGYPYKGYSWNETDEAQFETIEQAREAVKYLQDTNPVGWNIWDSETLNLVEGFDFFEVDL